MTVSDLSPHGPADRPIRIDITWTELLRTPDRQLRRLLAERYRHAVHSDTVLTGALAEVEAGGIIAGARRHQVAAMLDAEVARLNATAEARYQRMAAAFTARIRNGHRRRGGWVGRGVDGCAHGGLDCGAHAATSSQDWPGTGSDFLAFCMANDLEMTALCGYVWKPSRVPFGMPVCKTCVDIATNALTGGGAA